MNLTPDSFSDGGDLSPESFLSRLNTFGQIDILDIGAESTAPMNNAISLVDEWERISPYLSLLTSLNIPVSLDTYHVETIMKFADIWINQRIPVPLIWNDVSGKFDKSVHKFLKMRKDFQYVFCHNLAPDRERTQEHMDYKLDSKNEKFLTDVVNYFEGHSHSQVIFDPTFGFSKTYEQNWFLLENFHKLQKRVLHDKWLIGISRKSFLRKKYGTTDRAELDRFHVYELEKNLKECDGEILIRTHEPQLLQPFFSK